VQVASTLQKNLTLSISHETIYKYIWADKASGGKLYTHLDNHRRNVESAITPMIPEEYSLENAIFLSDPRPSKSKKESDIGRLIRSWNRGDHHCILTLIERKRGFILIGKLKTKTKTKTKTETKACLLRLIRLDRKKIKTMTSDNGTKFHGYKDIEEKNGLA